MALENSVQLTTVYAAAGAKAHPFSANERLKTFTVFHFQRQKKPNLALSFLPISSPPITTGFRKSSFVCKARGAVNDVKEVTESSWKELVIESESTVLVEFWAPWCGPCRMIEPVIKELAEQYKGKVVCLKLNTDISPSIASKYGIRSIPTVLFFKDGEKRESVIGAVPKTTLSATIDKYLQL